MIIIDDIMSEMSCFNFTNLISSMINHMYCREQKILVVNVISKFG
jgi:hypothetical protein